MRQIGTLPTEKEASILRDHLHLKQIEADIEDEDNGSYSIWVHDDNHLATAAQALEAFRRNPNANEFVSAPAEASADRSRANRAEALRRSTIADRARVNYEQNFLGSSWLPLVLIGICIVVAVISNVGDNEEALRYLFFGWVDDSSGFVDFRSGQIWRLITPIFIHFGYMHLIFNAMWLRDLGTFIESRFGTLYFAILVIAIAVISNVVQFCWNGPWFGGMSGVNYGLFGFLWIRGKYDRSSAWQLNSTIVSTMLIWYVLCLVPGLLGPVANGAHTGGLVVGAAWGFLSSGRLRLSR